MMLESKYKPSVIRKIRKMFPGCVIMKNDPEFQQGVPDTIILYFDFWATLEFKRSAISIKQPNQEYYVDMMNEMSFSAFIFPENEEEVLRALQFAYERHRAARVSLSQ